MTHVLLVAPMPIDQQRRGPAIRYWEFARVLSAEHTVTLLASNDDHPTHPDFEVRTCAAEEELEDLLATHPVVVVQGPAIQHYPHLAQILAAGRHYLVADLYDPITLEQLNMALGREIGQWLCLEYTALLNEQLRLGDFFLCANERQRDYWLGALAALGRINPDTYDGGDLRRLIEAVPFGLPAEPPQRGGPALKGVLPGIAPDDRVILWGGGIWDWLDPLTPVRAMEQVAAHHPTARLVFFDLAHERLPMSERIRRLAAERGLLGRCVLFADWLPPEQWSTCLLEADVGLSFHPPGIETHFAFRTRLLDYIWAGLPIVAADDDVLSEVVAAHGLGYVVEPGDAADLAQALIALLDEPDARRSRQEAFHQVAGRFSWERVAQPLVRYCRQPWRAGDAGQSFAERWRNAQRDRILSDMALAERRRLEAEALARTLDAERVQTLRQAEQLRAQVADLTRRLQQSEAQFQAAMNGRLMRLLTGAQQALRRLRGERP